MRRWVCIVALLAGFAGEDYVRGVRLREPVAVERVIEPRRGGTRGLVPTGACRNSMIAEASLGWSSLVSTSRMQCPAANRRALGTSRMR